MDDRAFWVKIWGCALLFLWGSILVVCVGSYFESTVVADAVKMGVDPIKARCGIVGFTDRTAAVCAVATR